MSAAGLKAFLTADWRQIVLITYEAPAALLAPLVPRGTELDVHRGRVLVSLVGFRFLNTRVLGCRVPGHQHFDEINLRFYVRRDVAGELRQGRHLRRGDRSAPRHRGGGPRGVQRAVRGAAHAQRDSEQGRGRLHPCHLRLAESRRRSSD